MTQLQFFLRAGGRRPASQMMPAAWELAEAPEMHLQHVIHRTSTGAYRPGADGAMLAEALRAGYIVVDDVLAPMPADISDNEVTNLLIDGDRPAFEGPTHQRLKLHGLLMALALDPAGRIFPEAQLGQGRSAKRPDLTLWHAIGLARTFEAGSVDSRSIFEQLQGDIVSVTVLPFCSLGYQHSIRGYSFRRADNPPRRKNSQARAFGDSFRVEIPPPLPNLSIIENVELSFDVSVFGHESLHAACARRRKMALKKRERERPEGASGSYLAVGQRPPAFGLEKVGGAARPRFVQRHNRPGPIGVDKACILVTVQQRTDAPRCRAGTVREFR